MPVEEIFYLPLSELAKRIETKKLSPVDLTQLYLDRSAKLGPRLNAYARLTPESALEQAKAAEKEIQHGHYRGPLHGIPYAAKDLLAVKNIPTTWGAKPYENQLFSYNATAIEHLNRVGAVLIGKAAMIELAGGMGYRFASASLQGATKNPWNPGCWTGGSSSGSAAIVAAGLAAFAIGTETWGSIVCPSAFCGVSGLRPTYGRVSRYGAMALAPSMDKIGPLARTAEDCAHIFASIAGHDPKDHSTLPIDKAAFTDSPSLDLKARPLRIGWLKNAWKQLDSGVAKALLAAERIVRKSFPSTKAALLPEGPFEDAANVIVAAEAAASFRSLIRSGKSANWPILLGKSRATSTSSIPPPIICAHSASAKFCKKRWKRFLTHSTSWWPLLSLFPPHRSKRISRPISPFLTRLALLAICAAFPLSPYPAALQKITFPLVCNSWGARATTLP